MQFRLSNLFAFTALAAMLSFMLDFIHRHWDLRSVYLGYYGPAGIPQWASGHGRDKWAEAFGAAAHVGVEFAPWILLMAMCCFAGAIGVHVKGGSR